MTLVHGGRVLNLQAPPPPPAQEGIILPTARPRNDAAGRIFLIIVDDLHLDFRNTGRIRDLFKRISRTLVHEGDMFGIVSTGPSSLAIDLTYDRKILDEAIKKITGNGLKPSDIIQGQDGAAGPDRGALPRARGVLDGARHRHAARTHHQPAQGRGLGQQRLRLQSVREARARRGSDLRRPLGPDAEEGQRVQPAVQPGHAVRRRRPGARTGRPDAQSANRANATFYTIDPRGLVAGADLDEQLDPADFQDHIRKTQDSLRVLAEETGGIAIVNQNNFDKGLKRIDAETSDYYVVGYYSTNPDPLKRTRKIEVKVERATG